MSFVPIAVAFVIAFVAGLATSHGASGSTGAVLMGATLSAATTGVVASLLQFLPTRHIVAEFALAAAAVAIVAWGAVRIASQMGFGDLPSATFLVWAIAAFSALMVSRSSGMRLPALRRRRTGVR